MRYFALVLCGLLTACCVKQPKEYTVIREVSRPVKTPVVEPQPEPVVQPMAEPVMVMPASVPVIPPYYTTLSSAPVVYYQDMPMMAEVVMMGEMEIEQPVEPVSVEPEVVDMPVMPADQVRVSQDMAHCVVVLQHPQGRDLVRCMNTDLTCIQSYEKLGYVQLRYTPHFAGSEDVVQASDYPARQWRSDNNIPRW